ncbi:MAG: acyl-CoA thioesterase [Bacteroidetes bacterium]|nr:acyl-CoA thioesterase [Bacteroidota bacterium]
MEGFNASIKIKLDWSEMDLFGHINNVAYFKFIQAARVNYCELVGINTSNPDEKLSFAVAATNCQFKKPLYYPGEIEVKTKIAWIKNSSLQMEHIILNQDLEICAEATDVIVLFDYAVNAKVTVPAEVRARIEAIEKRSF